MGDSIADVASAVEHALSAYSLQVALSPVCRSDCHVSRTAKARSGLPGGPGAAVGAGSHAGAGACNGAGCAAGAGDVVPSSTNPDDGTCAGLQPHACAANSGTGGRGMPWMRGAPVLYKELGVWTDPVASPLGRLIREAGDTTCADSHNLKRPVVVVLPPSVAFYVAVLACIRARVPYVPLDAGKLMPLGVRNTRRVAVSQRPCCGRPWQKRPRSACARLLQTAGPVALQHQPGM